jgi:microcystin degradation protein MlrC
MGRSWFGGNGGHAVRVGIIALLQESNTFIEGKTTLAHFEQDLLVEGEDVRRRLEGTHHEVGGFFEGLASESIEAVPIFAARALPYGVLTDATFETLLVRMDAALSAAGPLDGLLVAPHGATVSEGIADVDGCWLEMLRGRVGPKVPIIGTLDLHANLSPRMVAPCNALIAYRTNPHLDQKERGIDAAQLVARTLRGEVRPTMAAAFPPLAINIERQAIPEVGSWSQRAEQTMAEFLAEFPCIELHDIASFRRILPRVLTNSLLLGFPYADVPEMGAAVVVVWDGDAARAGIDARDLAQIWWQSREQFRGRLIGVEEAVKRAAKLDGPICLLDMGDNVGGGSPGDGTVLLHALHKARLAPTFVCLYDPAACHELASLPVGAVVPLRVGGHTDSRHGEPFAGNFRLRGLYNGRFEESEARHGGIKSFDQGPTAVVETESGMTVMLTSKRMVPFSIHQLTSCGLDPSKFRVLVAKGVHAPVAAYAPVCKHLIRVDTPGLTTADLSRLEYRNRRRPMYPFEPDMQWEPTEITMGHGL